MLEDMLRRTFGPKRDEVRGDRRTLHYEELHIGRPASHQTLLES
jgi:hypothetical protein